MDHDRRVLPTDYAELKGRAEARLRNDRDAQDIAALRLALAQEQAESVRQLAQSQASNEALSRENERLAHNSLVSAELLAQAQAREMALREALSDIVALDAADSTGQRSINLYDARCEAVKALDSPATGWPAEVEVLRDFARSALVVLRARGEQKELIEGLAKSLVPFEGVQ